jgi:hypothetical protein
MGCAIYYPDHIFPIDWTEFWTRNGATEQRLKGIEPY